MKSICRTWSYKGKEAVSLFKKCKQTIHIKGNKVSKQHEQSLIWKMHNWATVVYHFVTIKVVKVLKGYST